MYVIYGANSDLAASLIPYLHQHGEECVTVSRGPSGYPYATKHIQSEIMDIQFDEISDRTVWVPAFGKVGIEFRKDELAELINVNFVYVAYLTIKASLKNCYIVFPSTQRASLLQADKATSKLIQATIDNLNPEILAEMFRERGSADGIAGYVIENLREIKKHNIYDVSKYLAERYLDTYFSCRSVALRIGNLYGEGFSRGVFYRLCNALMRLDDKPHVEQQRLVYPTTTMRVNQAIKQCGDSLAGDVGIPFAHNVFPKEGMAVSEVVDEIRKKVICPGELRYVSDVNEKVWQRTLTGGYETDPLEYAFMETTILRREVLTYANLYPNIVVTVAVSDGFAECAILRSVDYEVINQLRLHSESDYLRDIVSVILEWIQKSKKVVDRVVFTCVSDSLQRREDLETQLAVQLCRHQYRGEHFSNASIIASESSGKSEGGRTLSDILAKMIKHVKYHANVNREILAANLVARDVFDSCVKLQEGFSDTERKRIRLACDVLHGVFSLHGEKGHYFIRHCLSVAETIKAATREDHLPDLVVAAIVHDVLEHSSVAVDQLQVYFGEAVADIVALVSQNREFALGAFANSQNIQNIRSDLKALQRQLKSEEFNNMLVKLEHFRRLLASRNEKALLLKVVDNFHNYSLDRFQVTTKRRSKAEVMLFYQFVQISGAVSETVSRFFQSRKEEFDFILQHHCSGVDLDSFVTAELKVLLL